jgi:O-antigen ligase
MSITPDKAIAAGLIVIIVFTALAHGVVEPWSALLFELMVAALVLLWAIKVFIDRKLTLIVPPIAWPLAALVALGLAQSVAWQDGAGNRQSLSLDVEATRGTVMALCCLLACCLLAANFLTSQARLRMMARFIPIYGMLLASLAVVLHFAAGEYSYWPWPIRSSGSFGPFVNRDHFAAYVELLIALPVALIVTRYVRGEKTMLYGVAATITGVAAVFTLSRGGMISLFAQMMFIAVMGSRRSKESESDPSRVKPARGKRALEAAIVTAILAAIVTGVVWIGAEPVINRIATGNPESADLSKAQAFHNVRGAIWQDTWRMIRENPIIGVGLGAYETAYPIFAWDRGVEGIVAQAHNDYLQILSDGGLIGGALALWFLVTVFGAIIRGACLRDPLPAGIALGGGAGIFGMLVHSLFDFGLQLPSHAVLFLSLSAVVSHIGAAASEPLPQTAASTDVISNFSEVPS